MSLNLKLPNEISFFFPGPQKLKLHGRAWTLPSAHQTLIGVHGYTEHSGCYRHFAKFWNERNVDVYWLDLPGHGESEGRRSDISNFDDYIASLSLFFEKVNHLAKVPARYLFAHSLGGLISLRFLQTSPRAAQIERVALSSPLLGLSEAAFHGLGNLLQSSIGLSVLQTLTTILPNLTLPNENDLGGSVLTHDKEMQERRRQDPLMRSVVTINWTREFLRARKKVFRDVDKITTPLGIFQAGEDFVVSRKSTELFFKRLSLQEKYLQIYEGLWHEVVNEVERERVMQDIADWLQLDRLAASAQGSN